MLLLDKLFTFYPLRTFQYLYIADSSIVPIPALIKYHILCYPNLKSIFIGLTYIIIIIRLILIYMQHRFWILSYFCIPSLYSGEAFYGQESVMTTILLISLFSIILLFSISLFSIILIILLILHVYALVWNCTSGDCHTMHSCCNMMQIISFVNCLEHRRHSIAQECPISKLAATGIYSFKGALLLNHQPFRKEWITQ